MTKTTKVDRNNDDESWSGSESSPEQTQAIESYTEGNEEIAAKETKEVRQVKVVIVLVVFMSILGALSVFFYSKRLEQSQFEKSFFSDGNKVLQSLERSVERSLVALDNLAMTITTTARAANQSFPFVAVPGFAEHVAKVAPIIGSHVTCYVPLVRFNERENYELFASEKNTTVPAYVAETLKFQETYPFYYGPKAETYSWEYRNTIYAEDPVDPPFSDVAHFNTTRPGLFDIYLPEIYRFPLVMNVYAPANWGEC
jgi:cytoskeletal protein RodZ